MVLLKKLDTLKSKDLISFKESTRVFLLIFFQCIECKCNIHFDFKLNNMIENNNYQIKKMFLNNICFLIDVYCLMMCLIM